MYSKQVTARNVAERSKKLGFTLTYHNQQQIEEQIKRLNEIVGDDGRLTRGLLDEEKLWIINERCLAKLDFRYFVSRYCLINHFEGGRIVHVVPNQAQNISLEVWAGMEEAGVAIMIQQLKARQLGMTTWTELAVTHRTQFYKHTAALVGSSDPGKSREMAGKIDLCWGNQPWWLRANLTNRRVGEFMEYGDHDSSISIQHGSQFTGLGRGSTISVAHLSEVSEYINPEELIDASLLNAMHPSPAMFLVLESTAKGRDNYWDKMWQNSVNNYDSGKASFYPMFLPWFVGKGVWPTDGWLKKHPIPEEFEPATLTCHHAERAKAYVHSNDLLRKSLGEEWEMPVEQMWWWEITREEYKAKDILSKFYEEMPADDLEAFQSTNRSAFSAETLSLYRENQLPPLAVYGFRGKPDEIPERMQPDRRDIDSNRPVLTVRSRWNPSQTACECQLVPLKFQGYPAFKPMGKLIVWEMPENEEEYGIGVDTGDGVGLDSTTAEVLRKGTIERNEAQVAEFHSSYIGASEFWPLALAISTLYSTELRGQLRQSKVVIDCLRNGETVQFEMQKRGWWNFHRWKRYDKKKNSPSDSHRIGWFSNAWSRAMMMDYIIRALKDDMVDISSPYFVKEMGNLERDEVRQSLKACYGGHDDLFVAMGQVYFSLHIEETRGNQPSMGSERLAHIQAQYIDPVWTPGLQGMDGTGTEGVSLREDLMQRVELEEEADGW